MAKAAHSATYGLPPRPTTAANPLWQHLLSSKDRAPTSIADISAIAPPAGPLDKNATSMRILLHDTQSNFEKFGKHVGQLFEEIKDCKLEMKALHSRFERDRESLMGDFIDLINRSQKECQKSIGSPAQSQQIETLFKNVEHRLSGIDHKLDAVQSFNQAHTQALQTQIQAVQLLLDKQASIIAAVSPLLPLLQALPLHIDTVKLSLKEALEKCMSTFGKENHRPYSPSRTRSTTTTGLTATVKRAEKRKWPGAEQSPSTSSTTPTSESPLHKKSRKNETTSNLKAAVVLKSTKEHNVTSRPSVGRRDSSAAFRGDIAAQTLSRKNVNDNDVFSTVGVSPLNSTAPMSSRNHVGISSIPKFATPRRPLTDLLPVPSSSSSILGSSPGQQRNKNMFQRHATRERSLGRSNTLAAVFPSANLRGSVPTPGQLQPPRILHVHNSHSLAGSSNVPYGAASVDSLENLRTYAASTSGQGSYTPNLSGLPQCLSIKREIVDETSNTVALAPTIASAGFEFLSSKPKATFGRQKDRRSPIKDGRRFIPLVDSEDEELEENIT